MTQQNNNNMTNEHNFKEGDKVAVKRSYTLIANGYENIIPIGEVGIVEDVDGEELLVDFPGYFCALTLNIADVEPIQPLDRRTAFLTRLQSLLREFDASFVAHKTDMPISVYFEGNEAPSASIGKEINKGCGVVVTADNIMDFDKD